MIQEHEVDGNASVLSRVDRTTFISKLGYVIRGIGIPALLIVLILILWEVVVRIFFIPVYILPGPLAIADSISTHLTTIQQNALVTSYEAIIGFLIGNGVAILLAICFVHVPVMERTVYPFAVALRAIPFVALTPILIIWMGNGMGPKVTIAALMVFFPTLVNMARGLRAVDPEALEFMRTISASWWQILWKLRWPTSLPYLFAALKIAAASVFIGAVVAEYIGADKGLGYLVISSSYALDVPLLWGTIVAASILSLVLFGLIILVERLTMHGVEVPPDAGA